MLFTVKGICYKTVALTIGMTACWISYGGILLNTINDEAQDQLIKYLILSVSEIPALFIGYYLVESRLGRRWTGVLGLTICAFFTMIIALVPSSNLLLISVLSGFGKFGVSITFMTTYQHAGELYPTTLRSQGLGFNCSIASTVCILLPQLVYMVSNLVVDPNSIIIIIIVPTQLEQIRRMDSVVRDGLHQPGGGHRADHVARDTAPVCAADGRGGGRLWPQEWILFARRAEKDGARGGGRRGERRRRQCGGGHGHHGHLARWVGTAESRIINKSCNFIDFCNYNS